MKVNRNDVGSSILVPGQMLVSYTDCLFTDLTFPGFSQPSPIP